MRLRTLVFSGVLALSLLAAWGTLRIARQARAEEDGIDKLTFCHFGPKMKVLDARDGNREKDPCSATAKIQGVQWECAPPEDVRAKVDEFRNHLADLAAEECRKHCRTLGSRCKGVLARPTHCGLETDRDDAVAMGQRQGCRSDCSGSSFIYCSLYDAGFRTQDEERVAKQAPNCRCMSAD